MAKSDSRAGGCAYLFHQVSDRAQQHCSPHEHPFWQCEIHRRGRLTAVVDGAEFALEPGTGILIPPHAVHGFTSHGEPSGFTSIKFSHPVEPDHDRRGILVGDERGGGILAAIDTFLPGAGEPRRHRRQALDHLLAALVAAARAEEREVPDDGDLVTRVRVYVERHAHRRVTVGEIAEETGYSTRHVSATFQEATGLALKRFVDRARADQARLLLTYGDGSVTDIAEQLDFPDLYAFSRFFRRMNGISPARFREQLQTV